MLFVLAGGGCGGGYTLIDQTATTSPAWVEATTPARDTRAAPDDGRDLTPRADQAPAATAESATTEAAEPSRGSAPVDSAGPVPAEPQ